jgi:NAD(P)-dependent dehydrogenase (short-subunit alcohol dehydrogenase family)
MTDPQDVPYPLASLRGRTVIVTGAAGDIGRVYVRAFAAAGVGVIAMDLPQAAESGREVAAQASAAGPGCAEFVPGDVTSDEDWDNAVRIAMRRFGRLDMLVNNAAIYRGIAAKRPLTELTTGDWDQIMAVNVRGTWQGIKARTPALAASGAGRVVNVTSVVARAGVPGFAHYVAAKAAVEGLTRAAARELGSRNICVNAVAPGLVDNSATRTMNDERYLSAAVAGRALARKLSPADLVGRSSGSPRRRRAALPGRPSSWMAGRSSCDRHGGLACKPGPTVLACQSRTT